LTVVLLLAGLAALVRCGLSLYEQHLSTAPLGHTAGAASSPADLCKRSTPKDVAAACLAEQARLSRIERYKSLSWGGLGLACLLIAAWRQRPWPAARNGKMR